MSTLREEIVKLAKARPELRQHLVPLLTKTASTDKEAASYRDTLKRLWDAYKKKHPTSRKPPQSLIDKAKAEAAKSRKKKDTKPKPKLKKDWPKPALRIMVKHGLTDEDGDEIKAFKKTKPNVGAKVSPSELMRRFLAKAKPETRERMKGVTPAEFMKMLAAIMDEEGEAAAK